MGLFNPENMIDESKLAREAVAALFDGLRKEPLVIKLTASTEVSGGSVTEALAGLNITISLGS